MGGEKSDPREDARLLCPRESRSSKEGGLASETGAGLPRARRRERLLSTTHVTTNDEA